MQLWRQPSISSSNKLESCRNIYRYPVSVTVHNLLEAVTALRFLHCVLDSMLLFWFLSQHRRETLSRVSRKRQSTMLCFDIQEDLLLILKTIDSIKLMIFANTDQHCLQSWIFMYPHSIQFLKTTQKKNKFRYVCTREYWLMTGLLKSTTAWTLLQTTANVSQRVMLAYVLIFHFLDVGEVNHYRINVFYVI